MRAALAFLLVAAFAAGVASAQETQQEIADRIVREQQNLRLQQVNKVMGAQDRAMGGSTLQPYTAEAPGGPGPSAPKPAAPAKPASGGIPTWLIIVGLIIAIPVALVIFVPHKKPSSPPPLRR